MRTTTPGCSIKHLAQSLRLNLKRIVGRIALLKHHPGPRGGGPRTSKGASPPSRDSHQDSDSKQQSQRLPLHQFPNCCIAMCIVTKGITEKVFATVNSGTVILWQSRLIWDDHGHN
ncbi:unnamed protein product [Mesocestoides corti]|uniref:Uncharacterized protein n=1 Tax=Mesocestoides corti TaxID=53468 RepID=A0A3P6I7A4_MESCO|nr:unnamed protein product [Mesocestoides corti]